MARHQTIFHWGIEVLDFLVFVAGVATAAVAAVGFWNNGRVAIIFLGGLPTVFCLAVGFRLCSAAFLKRRVPRFHVDGDEEGGTLQGATAHGLPTATATRRRL
ncbi:RING-H2 finger protein ATL30-like [Panicum miliaceum]|uniref:RING-H2 finger protein ATL30-like n=1 Tax=Panicum miliaceum TaxID=4540 RepID=A0A3L6PC11_PANMI|nr:RING-H2 finger protein ATL30-like [Panicum miliaceum]